MKIRRFCVLIISLICGNSIAATATSISATQVSSSIQNRTVDLQLTISGDIVVRRVAPNPQETTSRIRVYVNNSEVVSYTAAQAPHSAEYNRYDYIQRCNQSGSCSAQQVVFSNTSRVDIRQTITIPSDARSVSVYVTFDGDRYSSSASLGKMDVTLKSPAPIGALINLLDDEN
jgi:hypothetical protein